MTRSRATNVASTAVLLTAVLACATTGTTRSPGAIIAAEDSIARATIQRERSLDPSTYPPRSVGVGPLRVTATDTSLAPLGYGLADLIITDLSRSQQLVVVDRIRLDALLRELRLASTGRVDSATAPRVGRLVGARRIVIGEVMELPGGQLRLGSRVAETQTGAISAVASATGRIDAIFDLEKRLVFELFDGLQVTLTPRERAEVEQRPTRNIAALLAYSRGVRAEVLGNLPLATSEYEAATRLDPNFRLARTKFDGASRRMTGGPSRIAEAGGEGRLRSVSRLALDAVNRPLAPVESDVTQPAFANAQRRGTLIITVILP
jgi:TolB-like protein